MTKIASCFAALLASHALSADTVDVHVPPYWTGTLNLGRATAVGGPFDKAECWVNGEFVKEWIWEGGAMQHVTLARWFDSTHFTNGNLVSVEYKFRNVSGTWTSDSESVMVENYGFAWEFPEFINLPGGHSSDNVKTHAEQAGWTCGEDHSDEWDPVVVRNVLGGCGIHYVNSHGNPTMHWTAVYDMIQLGDIWVKQHRYVYGAVPAPPPPDDSYLAMRIDQVGDYTGSPPAIPYPPYNPSGVPYVTFAFIDACESGRTYQFNGILYPFYIYGYTETVDQAVLTWNGFSRANHAEVMNTQLWSRLASKKTIVLARTEMILDQATLPKSQLYFVIKDQLSDPWRAVTSPADVPIWGDHYTRIHGIYTGNNSLPTGHPDWWI